MINVKENNMHDDLTGKLSSIKEETEELVKNILSLLNIQDYSFKKTILYVKRLSDGIDESDDYFENKFITGELKYLSHLISFEKLPIVKNIEKCEYPLLLVSDENEIDKYTRKRIIKRKESGFETFPIIVFSDNFFTIRTGEGFGYISIIESIEEACGDNCHAMAFKMSELKKDNVYVKAYVDYLDIFFHVRDVRECVNQASDFIDNVIDRFNFVLNDTKYNVIKKLIAIAKIRSCLIFRNNLIIQSKKLDELTEKVNGLIINIRNKYDEHIWEIMKNEPLKAACPMAVKIDLKYGTLKEQILRFLYNVSISNLFKNNYPLPNNTIELVEKSYEEVNTNTSELTLIGTFSSGKTTMINTFLKHNHKLHTSKNHNTAVLMHIKKKPTNEQFEFYEMKYKKNLRWSLIKPAYLETKLYRNPFPGQAKVIKIKQTDLYNIVTLKELSGEKRVQDVRVGKMHQLCISERNIINCDDSLIKIDESEKELQLASKNELLLLLDFISKKKLKQSQISISYKNGKRENKDKNITDFLKKLIKCNKYNTVSNDNRQPMVSAKDLSELMGVDITYAIFHAEIIAEEKKIRLDEKGWENFCSSKKNNSLVSDKIPYCEAPECYMLVEHINVYLDSEFLNYCSLNDTPGFGSITEEHDACTERFISSSKSRLLAMVTINSKSEDTKLYDFLHFIANNRKNKMNEVYFMLNCFSNNTVEKKIQSDVNKVSNLIVDLGFNKRNIYVCDLRKSTEEAQEMSTMCGLPSYASFRQECINNMLESGLVSRYNYIYENWNKYFKDNINFIDNRLKCCEVNLNDGEKQIKEYKNKIQAVNDIKNPSIESILKEVYEKYREYYEYIRSVFYSNHKHGGIFFLGKKRREACIEAINQIKSLSGEELERFDYEIKEVVKKSLNELEVVSDIYSDVELKNTNYTLFTLAIQNIKDKLMIADKNTYFFTSSEQCEYYMEDIWMTIKEDYEKSSLKAMGYFNELNCFYVNRKSQALITLNKELEEIENPELIREAIKSYCVEKDEIEKLKQLFDNIINIDVLKE